MGEVEDKRISKRIDRCLGRAEQLCARSKYHPNCMMVAKIAIKLYDEGYGEE